MPLRFFNCPDGITRPITECLEKCPRPEGRCLSLPTLHEVAFDRTWQGKASTTQLLNPTRMEYLKINKDFAIAPKDRAFALLGTQHHRRLEIITKKIKELEAEKRLSSDTNTGMLDLLEPDNGKWILTDYKTWGSYSVLKIKDPESYERLTASLQLNDYRLMAESLGFEICKMQWQITVRDGGTKSAYANKIEDRILTIEAERLDNDFVTDYFYTKNKALLEALDKNELPELCNYEERWNGRRCKGSLCEVHMFCPEGAKVNKIELVE